MKMRMESDSIGSMEIHGIEKLLLWNPIFKSKYEFSNHKQDNTQ